MAEEHELWQPRDIIFRRLTVELQTVDYRQLGDDPNGVPKVLRGPFRASASVYLGLDGSGAAIWKDVEAAGVTASDVLQLLWGYTRVARLPHV